MKKLAWFLSNHGYGHVMRNTPLILEALGRGDVEITVVTAQSHLEVLARYVHSPRLKTVAFENTDYGLEVIPGTLLVDAPRLETGIRGYTAQFGARAAWAEQLLRAGGFDTAVVDMPVWALTGAKAAGVKSVLITNFTWVEIYREYLPDALAAPFRDAYRAADRVLYYELANREMKALLPGGVPCGLVARPFDAARVAEIRADIRARALRRGRAAGRPETDCAAARPLVFCSIGCSNSGLSKPLCVEGLPYEFITTAELAMEGSNVTRLPQGVADIQNYTAAADYCITKAGWGTVAETLLAGKPVALMARDTVAEDRMTIEELEKRGAAVKIEVAELADMGAVMQKLTTFAYVPRKYEEDSRHIVDEILK